MRMQVKRDMSRADRRAWASARTVPDIGARTAQWLSGDLGYSGGGYDVPDEETEDLIPALVAANRAGFATVGSQPGGRWEDEEYDEVLEQRAFVEGFIDQEDWPGFRDSLTAAGLGVREGGGPETVLTLRNGEPMTVQPEQVITSDYHSMLAGCRGSAIRAARRSVYVLVVDSVFERNDLLWPALESWAAAKVAS